MLEIAKRYEIEFVEIGTDQDHAHFLIQSVPTYSPRKVIQTMENHENPNLERIEHLKLGRVFIEHAPSAVLIVQNGKYAYCNPAGARLLGYISYQDVIGVKAIDTIAETSRELIISRLANIEQKLENSPIEIEIQKPDGSISVVETTSVPIDFQGKPAALVIGLDITEKKGVETALYQTDQYWQKTFDAISDSICNINIEGEILRCNQATARLLKKPIDEIIGSSYHQLFTDYDNSVGVNMLSKVNQSQQREVAKVDIFDQIFEVIADPIFSDQEEITGIVHVMRDITEHQQVEDTLREQKANVTAIIENTTNRIWSVDDQYRLITANSSFFQSIMEDIGIKFQPGDNILNLDIHSKVKKEWQGYYDRAFQGEHFILETNTFFAPKTRIMEYHFNPIINTNGLITGVAVIGRDITERKQLEKALQESEARHQRLLSSISVYVWNADIVDGEIIFRYYSPVVEEITGYPPEYFLGGLNGWLNTIHPDDRPRIKKDLEKELLGNVIHHEYRIIRADGEVRWLSDSISPTLDQAGHIIQLNGVVSDITKQKQAERARKQSEEKYRLLSETTQDIIILHDMKGQIVYINQAGLKFADCELSEVLGQSIYEFIPPEQLDSIATRQRLRNTGDKQTYRYETEFVNRVGEQITVDVRSTPIIQAEQISNILIVARDITAKKQATEELRRTERRYRALIENAPDGIVLLGSRNRIEYASPSALSMFGFNADEINTIDPNELTHPDDLPSVLDLLEKISDQNPEYTPTIEYRFSTKQGDWLWIESTFSNLLAQEDVGAIIINFRDITDRKRIEEKLLESEKRYHDIASQMPGAIYQFRATPDGNYSMDFISEGAVALFNKPLVKIMDVATMFDQLHPDDHEAFFISIEESMKHMTPWNHIYRVIWESDQTVHWIRGHSNPSKDVDGSTIWNGVLLDITSQKNAELGKQKHQDRYELLFNTMLDGYALHEIIIDQEGKPIDYRFLDINLAFEQLTGLKKSAVIGKTVLSILPKTEPYWIERYGHVALTGESLKFEDFSQEFNKYFEVSVFSPEKNQFATIFLDVTGRKKAEEALKESQRQLATLLGNLPGIAFRCHNDRKWTMEFISDGCKTMTGYPAEDIVGNRIISFADLTHQDDREMIWQTIQNALKQQKPFQLEFRIFTANGEEKWVWEQGIGVEDNQKIFIEGFISDITERKKAEEALVRSEENLNKAQAIAQIGSWVWYIPTNQLVWSDEMFRIFGIDQDTFDGNLGKVMQTSIHPDDREAVELSNSSVINNKNPVPLEYRIIRPNGQVRVVWAEAGELTLDEESNPIILSGIVQDITERKQVEEALKKSEQKYRQLFEELPVGIFQSTPAGRYRMVNPTFAKMIGFNSPDEVTEQIYDIADLYVNPEDREEIKRIFKEKGNVTGHEILYRHQSGEERWVAIYGKSVYDEKGDVVLYDGFTLDVTARRQVERALLTNQQKLRTLAQRLIRIQEEERLRLSRDLHDEAGQALSVVKVYLNMLEKEIVEEHPDLAVNFDRVKSALANAHDHFRSLAATLRPPTIEILGVVGTIENLCQTVAKQTGLQIEFHSSEIASLEEMAAITLFRVAQEGLSNISSHAEADLAVVSIYQMGREIILQIRDNGKGVDLKSLFEDQGLGIIGMQERMEYIGGSLTIESAPGKGTTLTATYPISDRKKQ